MPETADGERQRIATLRAAGHSIREVARRLGRSASTISRELQRNTIPHDRGGYDAVQMNAGFGSSPRHGRSMPAPEWSKPAPEQEIGKEDSVPAGGSANCRSFHRPADCIKGAGTPHKGAGDDPPALRPEAFHDLAYRLSPGVATSGTSGPELSVEGRPHRPEWSVRPVRVWITCYSHETSMKKMERYAYEDPIR
ncbi:helix-turn-helix domain-containing protein [Rhodococcus sp. NPDC003318]|uniref:helix-turn-helix domain-containing protein n=1 Tax=Rhodococcus sp. NPDC003318 TaxID=3364503 RepID=UPI0036C8A621